jgi:hypothetical protein
MRSLTPVRPHRLKAAASKSRYSFRKSPTQAPNGSVAAENSMFDFEEKQP